MCALPYKLQCRESGCVALFMPGLSWFYLVASVPSPSRAGCPAALTHNGGGAAAAKKSENRGKIAARSQIAGLPPSLSFPLPLPLPLSYLPPSSIALRPKSRQCEVIFPSVVACAHSWYRGRRACASRGELWTGRSFAHVLNGRYSEISSGKHFKLVNPVRCSVFVNRSGRGAGIRPTFH